MRRVAVLVCNREQGVLKVLGNAKTTGTAIGFSRMQDMLLDNSDKAVNQALGRIGKQIWQSLLLAG